MCEMAAPPRFASYIGLGCLLALSFTVCSGLDAQSLDVRERWATKRSPQAVELAAVNGMAEDRSGNVWIADPVNRLLVMVDGTGRHPRVTARQGDGPGEVAVPMIMAPHPSGGVAVFDAGHGAVEVFGPAGRFDRRIPVPVPFRNPRGFAFLPSGDFFLSGGIQASGHAIHRFSPGGRLSKSWHTIPRTRNARAGEMIAGGPVVVLPDGSLLFSQSAPHRIVRYAATGGSPRTIAADAKLVPAIGDDFIQESGGRRTFRWDYTRSAGVFRLPDGRILNIVLNEGESHTVWEVYRPDGKLVGRTRVTRAYQPWGMTRNGDVLASDQDPDTDEAVAARLTLTFR
jgi:hypothetical protein